MSNVREAIKLISGSEPPPGQIGLITEIADHLDIPTRDPLFPLVAALITIINVIKQEIKSLKATPVIVKEDLIEAVADAATKVADKAAKKQMFKWATGCIAVSCLCFGLFGWFTYTMAYKSGVNSGYGTGYAVAVDEKAAAAWANTPEGKMAYKLAQTNQFKNLIHCDLGGWYIKNGACFVERDKDGTLSGWQIP